jgi:outer membrane protein OmpA-like peptidoglycan-associated protein
LLVETLAQMSRQRMPWSRIVIASYCTSRNPDSQYANYLSKKRAEVVAQEFVRLGVEPRRVIIQPIVTKEPVLVDPEDSADRYRQALELIPLDY